MLFLCWRHRLHADAGAADELMAALKACKAGSAATKSAQAMIKKDGGKPSDVRLMTGSMSRMTSFSNISTQNSD
jgi:hypothetical protein